MKFSKKKKTLNNKRKTKTDAVRALSLPFSCLCQACPSEGGARVSASQWKHREAYPVAELVDNRGSCPEDYREMSVEKLGNYCRGRRALETGEQMNSAYQILHGPLELPLGPLFFLLLVLCP